MTWTIFLFKLFCILSLSFYTCIFIQLYIEEKSHFKSNSWSAYLLERRETKHEACSLFLLHKLACVSWSCTPHGVFFSKMHRANSRYISRFLKHYDILILHFDDSKWWYFPLTCPHIGYCSIMHIHQHINITISLSF